MNDTDKPMPSAEERPIRPMWLDQRRGCLRFEFDNGPIAMEFPRLLRPAEIEEFEAMVGILISQYRRRAKSIEAQATAPTSEESSHE